MTSMATSRPAPGTSGLLRTILAVCLALPGLLLGPSAGAKQSDRSQPVNVDANYFDGSAHPNGISHLKGDVVITQGTLKITSDQATVYFDDQSQVKRVVLTGHAHIQQLDDNGNLMTGDAGTIDYDTPAGIATLTGDAHVEQAGRGSASGGKIVYDTKTSTMTGQSSGGDRVHLTFKPRQQPAAGAAPARPASAGN